MGGKLRISASDSMPLCAKLDGAWALSLEDVFDEEPMASYIAKNPDFLPLDISPTIFRRDSSAPDYVQSLLYRPKVFKDNPPARLKPAEKLHFMNDIHISGVLGPASSSRDDSDRRNFRDTLRHQHHLIQRTPYPAQGAPPPTLASANDRRTSKIYRRSQYRDSEPQISGLGLTATAATEFDLDFVAAAASKSSIGLGLETYGAGGYNALDQGTGRPLDGPFTLRKSQVDEYARARSNSYRRSFEIQDTSIEGSTSFMDITPERHADTKSCDAVPMLSSPWD